MALVPTAKGASTACLATVPSILGSSESGFFGIFPPLSEIHWHSMGPSGCKVPTVDESLVAFDFEDDTVGTVSASISSVGGEREPLCFKERDEVDEC